MTQRKEWLTMSTTLWNGANQISGSSISDIQQISANLRSDSVQFKFGIDSSGNYGYYKDNSVVPFKTSDKIINSRFPNGTTLTPCSFVLTSNGKTYSPASTVSLTELTTTVGTANVLNGKVRVSNSSTGSGMAFTPDYIDLTDVNYIFTEVIYAASSGSNTGFQMKLTIVNENENGIELADVGLGFNNTEKHKTMVADVSSYSGKYKIGLRAYFPQSGRFDVLYIGMSS